MRRRVLRAALVTIALVAVCIGAAVLWLHSDDARQRFEALASAALHRQVRVEAIDVGVSRLTLTGLAVSDPWSDGPALTVARGEFEPRWSVLLDGGLAGTLRAEAFEVDVRKRGQETNFHGMRRASTKPRPLDLMLELQGGDVRLHDEDRGETVSIEGVGLSGRVQRADAQPVVSLETRADHVRALGIAVHDVSVVLGVGPRGVELSTLAARLEEGTLEGEGHLAFDARSSWSARLDARDVGLRDELLPIVVAVFPAAAGVQSEVEGRLSLASDVRGAGLTHGAVLQSLHGDLAMRLDGVVLPRETAVVRVAALLGRPVEPMPLERLEIAASVRGPWVQVDAVRSGGRMLELPFEGRVSLEGRLDLQIDVLPLMAAIPSAQAWVRRYTTAVPVRVEGTTSEPLIRPPPASVLAKALAGAWAERTFGVSVSP